MSKCGAKTEVFSRVCGYHRPIRNWNKGKQQEFDERREYSVEKSIKAETKANHKVA
ncbi:MAG: anaerobic ribonucleoside-triphosphate reductase [Candidatus Nanoarchaeia archaeon]